jgi:hypothetical protein
MAIKGSIVKEEIAKKILETFEGSFKYDKEIRVPMLENGELVQIKITLTAAKVAVEPNGDVALPGADNAIGNRIEFEDVAAAAPEVPKVVEPTAEEKKNIADLLASIGL